MRGRVLRKVIPLLSVLALVATAPGCSDDPAPAPTDGSGADADADGGGLVCEAPTPTECDGACVNTQDDENHCGACGTACQTDWTCESGVCTAPPVVCESVTVSSDGNVQTIRVGDTLNLSATCAMSDNTQRDVTDEVTWASSDAAIASVAGGLASGVAVGTVSITATYVADGVTSPGWNLTVIPEELLEIEISCTGATCVSDSTAQIDDPAATATFEARCSYSNAPQSPVDCTDLVDWSSSVQTVATMNANVAEPVGSGTTTVTAEMDNVTSNDATVIVDFSEVCAEIQIDPDPDDVSLPLGDDASFTALCVTPDGDTYEAGDDADWESSDTSVATVDDDGNVTTVGEGSATITVTVGDTTFSFDVTVGAAPLLSIEVNPPSANIPSGFTQSFTATGIYNDGSTADISASVSWTSSNTGVATVDAAGVATGVAPGASDIVAELDGITGSATLTVSDKVAVEVQVNPASATLPVGNSQAFTATCTYSDATSGDCTGDATWSSSDTGVASVTAAGMATGAGVGSAVITASVPGAGGPVEGSAQLTVTDAALVGIDVEPPTATVASGISQAFTADCTYTDGSVVDCTDSVSWSSEDNAIATVNNSDDPGLATGEAAGVVTIVAESGDVSGEATLTVTDAELDSIEVTFASPSVVAGLTVQATATCIFTDGSSSDCTTQVLWASSNTLVASVANAPGSKGAVLGVTEGTAGISASLDGVTGSADITVSPEQLEAVQVTPANGTVVAGLTLQYVATCLFTDGSLSDCTDDASWLSSDSAVATVNNAADKGLATGASQGSVTITATVMGVAGTANLTVSPAQIAEITVDGPSTAAAGTTAQFTATCIFTDGNSTDCTTTVTWASDAGAASVSNAAGSKGLVTAISPGAASISATAQGVSGSTILVVTDEVLTAVEVEPQSQNVPAGFSEAFSATCIFSDGTTTNCTADATWSSSNTGIASISNAPGSNGLATGVSVGTVTITATIDGFSDTATLNVTPEVLTEIQVTPSTSTVGAGLTQQLEATCIYSDLSSDNCTSAVTWASLDTGIAVVSNAGASKGLVTGQVVGSATIAASLQGVTGTATVTVTTAVISEINITPANATVAAGLDVSYTATCVFTDGSTSNCTETATWTSGDNAIATVSNSAGSKGVATGEAQGATTISAAQGGVTGSVTLTVTNAVLQSIEITPSGAAATVAAGLQLNFTATCIFSDGSNSNCTAAAGLVWASDDDGIATISNAAANKGRATGVAPGSVVISAVFQGITGTVTLSVTDAILNQVQVTPTTATVAEGFTQQYTATCVFSNGTTSNCTADATWQSNDTAVATVSNAAGSKGEATAVTVGGATITATNAGVSGSATITVTNAVVVNVEVSPANASVAAGNNVQLTATCTFSDNDVQDCTGSATWVSANNAVASVSNAPGSKGLATGEAEGTTSITATVGGVVGTGTVNVTPALLQAITVSPFSVNAAAGFTQAFTATCQFTDLSTAPCTTQVTWSSSNTTVATISNATGSEGVASALALGTTTITATLQGVSGTATFLVSDAILQSVTVTPASPSVIAGFDQQFTATCAYSDGTSNDCTLQTTWSSDLTSVATISNANNSKGLATAEGVGSASITATLQGISGTATMTVTDAIVTDIQISPSGASVAAGLNQQFSALCINSDSTTTPCTAAVTWSSDDASVATVSNAAGNEGNATGVAAGSAQITATFVNAVGDTITSSVTLTVTAAQLVSIDVTPNPATVVAGLTVAFTATCLFTDSSNTNCSAQVSWTTQGTGIAQVDAAGVATGVAPGTEIIQATLSGITGSATLTVSPKELVSVEVTPGTASVAAGIDQAFGANCTYTDGSVENCTTQVTWSSDNVGVADVNAIGVASTLTAGTAIITAQLQNEEGTATLTVTDAVLSSIQVAPPNATVIAGLTQGYGATCLFTDGTTEDCTDSVTWTSDDGSVATVSNAAGTEGVVTGIAVGTATITATDPATTISATAGVTVTDPVLVAITVTPSNSRLPVNFSLQYTATGEFTDGTFADITTSVTWTSSDQTVASIENAAGNEGRARGQDAGPSGSTTIQITATDSATGIFDSVDLEVTDEFLFEILVEPASTVIKEGLTLQYLARGIFTDDGLTANGFQMVITDQVLWTLTDDQPGVVNGSIDQTGLFEALLAQGDTENPLVVNATNGSVTGTADVFVRNPLITDVRVDLELTDAPIGLPFQAFCIGIDEDLSEFDLTGDGSTTWSSSNTGVATISNAAVDKGTITPVGTLGGADFSPVTITCNNTNAPNLCPSGICTDTNTVTVHDCIVNTVEVTPADVTVPNGLSQQFQADGTYEYSSDGSACVGAGADVFDITQVATWTSFNTNVAEPTGDVGRFRMIVDDGSFTTIQALYQAVAGTAIMRSTDACIVEIQIQNIPPLPTLGIQQATVLARLSSDNPGVFSVTLCDQNNPCNPADLSFAVIGDQGYITVDENGIVRGVQGAGDNPVLLGQDFDALPTGGLPQNWIFTDFLGGGIVPSVQAIRPASNPNALYFGDPNTLDYATGSRVNIMVETPVITQPVGANATVSFDIWYETEGGFDQMEVRLSDDNGVLSDTILALFEGSSATDCASGFATASDCSDPTGGGGGGVGDATCECTGTNDFVTVTYQVPPAFQGANAKLQFIFDTGDGAFNNFEGFHVDNFLWTQPTNNLEQDFTATLVSPGCGGAFPSDTQTVQITSANLCEIVVFPDTPPNFPEGVTVQMAAEGRFKFDCNNPGEIFQNFDVSEKVSWQSTAPEVATVNADGLVTTVDSGAAGLAQTLITAAFEGLVGSRLITVVEEDLVAVSADCGAGPYAQDFPVQCACTGTYTDGSTQDLTGSATWGSADFDLFGFPTGVGLVTGQGLTTPGTADAAGTVDVTCDFGGFTGTTSVTVTDDTLVTIDVAPADLSVQLGEQIQYSATGNWSDGSSAPLPAQLLTWDSTVQAVVDNNDISAAGVVTTTTVAADAGGTLIRATFDQDFPGELITGQTSLTVTADCVTDLVVTPADDSLIAGQTQAYTATANFANGTTQDWTSNSTFTSSNTSFATFTDNVVTTLPVGSGGATVGITAATTNNVCPFIGSQATGSTTLDITEEIVQSLTVTCPPVIVDFAVQCTVIGNFSAGPPVDLTNDPNVTWGSSDVLVAQVDQNGVLLAIGPGSADIDATYDPPNQPAVTADTTVTPLDCAISSVTVSPSGESRPVGFSVTYSANATWTGPDAASCPTDITDDVVWSADPGVSATITAAGVATTQSVGSTDIDADFSDALGNVTTGSTTLTTTADTLASVAIQDPNGCADDIPEGLSCQLELIGTWTGTSCGGSACTANVTDDAVWTDDDDDIAIISGPGLVTAVSPGTVLIVASIGALNDSLLVTVTSRCLEDIEIRLLSGPSLTNQDLPPGVPVEFSATGNFSDGSSEDITTQVTWGSGNGTAIPTPDSNGQTLTGPSGLANISATFTAATNCEPGEPVGDPIVGNREYTVFDVEIDTITVDTDPSGVTALPLGQTVQFQALADYVSNVPGQWDITDIAFWQSANTNVATVTQEGVVTADNVQVGQTIISATVGLFFEAYTLDIVDAVLTQLDITPSLPYPGYVQGDPMEWPEGGFENQFDVTATFSDGTVIPNFAGTVAWSSDNSAATVSPGGLVTSANDVASDTTAVITASAGVAGGGTVTDTLDVIVLDGELDFATLISDNDGDLVHDGDYTIALDDTEQWRCLFDDGLGGNAFDLTQDANWSSDNPTAVGVALGQVSRFAAGAAVIQCSADFGSGAVTTNQVAN